jgi:hypothetical protein
MTSSFCQSTLAQGIIPPNGPAVVSVPKKMLLGKAYQARLKGGAVIVYMLIETPGGFDYTGADCQSWLREIGFSETRAENLAGSDWMTIRLK